MGQPQSSFVSNHEIEFNGNYDFFQKLDLAATQKIIARWHDGNGKVDGSSRLVWKKFFSTLIEIQEELESDREKYCRKHWSPVCNGYAMVRQSDGIIENGHPATIIEEKTADDAHTDDDESETNSNPDDNEGSIKHGDQESQAFSGLTQRTVHQHPIFMGYSFETLVQRKLRLQSEKNKIQEREERAMERAISARSTALNQMEEQFRTQKQNRDKKIEQIKADYEREQAKRKSEYEKSTKDLDATLAGSIKVSLSIFLGQIPYFTNYIGPI